jgi:hypothetical protein
VETGGNIILQFPFIYGLFNDLLINSYYTAWNDGMMRGRKRP